ncbi:5-oxoprolinase subunit B family protein [Micromonospora sp. DT15]|uniref:5-oxoprolinase subunit B family protein n=1 Tax=Micromonospora sp. DT15 TaxID=3393445 RepID=UPI003CEDF292
MTRPHQAKPRANPKVAAQAHAAQAHAAHAHAAHAHAAHAADADARAARAREAAAHARADEADARAAYAKALAAADIEPGAGADNDARARGAAELRDATAEDGADEAADVFVPVTFDGPDLAAVAEHWGVDVPAVRHKLTSTRFRVAFCGFAPGFPYLTGLPAELALPRLATPRPRVPAGSVALAGPYAGIYPGASPGGWLLVGRTDLVLFDVAADPPARLGPGTTVRMVAA